MTESEKECYDRGFAQGKIQGRVDHRSECCSKLKRWADSTRPVNPDIAIGYDHAIALIRDDFNWSLDDWDGNEESEKKHYDCNHDCDAIYEAYDKGKRETLEETKQIVKSSIRCSIENTVETMISELHKGIVNDLTCTNCPAEIPCKRDDSGTCTENLKKYFLEKMVTEELKIDSAET